MDLKTYREREGHTLETFGELIGKSKSTVARYEDGSVEPSLAVIRKIAEVTKGAVPHSAWDKSARPAEQEGAAA